VGLPRLVLPDGHRVGGNGVELIYEPRRRTFAVIDDLSLCGGGSGGAVCVVSDHSCGDGAMLVES